MTAVLIPSYIAASVLVLIAIICLVWAGVISERKSDYDHVPPDFLALLLTGIAAVILLALY